MKRDPERGMRAFSISRTLLFSLLVAMPSTLPLSSCVERKRNAVSTRTFRAQTVAPTPESQPRASEQQSLITTQNNSATARININTASVKELEKLPGIGKGLAERIVEHREKYGPFRRPEHLIMMRGISDKRFRALRDSITVE